ncbi:MAG: hypothetical protein IJ849_09595 [Selenomonadaceae bacterium]|nr:hypothetical protein [Selenomonadaceae bacterium]
MSKENTYIAFRRRQQKEFESFPCFYAFSDGQLEDGMRKLGVADTDELYRGVGGMYYRKTDSVKLMELITKLDEELKAAFADDNFLFDALTTELANHEYCITYDAEEALDALGLSEAEVTGDKRMSEIFKMAVTRYLEKAVCQGVSKMTNKERMEELIYVFADADKRFGMTEAEKAKAPTLRQIIEAMSE